MKIGIIGGGAAGFFTAINMAESNPRASIRIFEGSNKLLSKVLISGGGRCNVCNAERDSKLLAQGYPRGGDFLLALFENFGTKETVSWFSQRGIKLKTEDDGRMFPESNSSASIANCFLNEAKRLNIRIDMGMRLRELKQAAHKWELYFGTTSLLVDKVIICTGGSNAIWQMLGKLGLALVSPVPSLFTFTVENKILTVLAGVSVRCAELSLKGSSAKYTGPLLITHKGLSGPAVLKMSAWEARTLSKKDYTFSLMVSWLPLAEMEHLEDLIMNQLQKTPKEKVWLWIDHGLPKRLYQMLMAELPYREYTNWSELGKKGAKAILQRIFYYEMEIKGKNTFKEEFVTAGGIELNQLNHKTLEAKNFPNLYFAGEVLNIDGITGGYNFQAAWTTAYHVAHSF